MAEDKPLSKSQLTTQELCSTEIDEQWRILQPSLTTVHNSITKRVDTDKCCDTEVDVRPNNVDLREKLSDKRRRVSNESEIDVDEKPKFVDLREKLMEKRRRIGNESEDGDNVSEIDVRRKFVDLREKLKEIEHSEDRSEKSNVIELYNELYAALESKEKRNNEEFKRKCEVLESKEKDISMFRRVFEAKARELKSRQKEMDKRVKMLEGKEKNLEEFRRLLELKEKNLLGRLELKEKLIEERFADVKSKEMSLELKEKAMEERCGEIKLKEDLAMSELCKVVDWKFKQMDKRFDAMETERNRDLRGNEIRDANGRTNVTCSLKQPKRELTPPDTRGVVCSTLDGGLRGKQIDDANDTHGVVCSTVDGGLRGKQINDANDGLRFKEKIVGECGVDDDRQETEKDEKKYNAPCEEFTLMDTKVNQYIAPQAIMEKQTNKCIDQLESKEKDVSGEVHGIVSSVVDSSSVLVCSDIHMLCQKMDTSGVRSYMIRCVKEHNILDNNIFVALRSTSDPTKLVLDISWNFFEEVLDKADSDANKISCIHLLEQLIKLAPPITPVVEHEARDFAVIWKERLNSDREVAINHYGFLHFVAAYKLAKNYNGKQLLSIFKASYFAAKLYPPEKNVELCRALGVQDEIPDFIRSLIEKQKQLEAVKCIYLFKMECVFPPVPLIAAYVELVEQKLNERLENEISRCWKVDAVTIELSHLCGALSYILSLELPYMFPTDSLSSRIDELKANGTKKMIAKSLRKRRADSSGTAVEQLQKRPRLESDVSSCPQSRTPSVGNTSNTMPNV